MQKKRTRTNWWNQFFRYPIYRKMLTSFCALIITLVLLIGLLLMQAFNRNSTEQMLAYSRDMMGQRVYSTELLWEEMESLASSIYSETDTLVFLNLRSEDKVIKYHAGQMLTRAKSVWSFVRDISLVNLNASSMVSTLNYDGDFRFFRDHAVPGRTTWSERVIPAPNNRHTDLFVLSMVYPLKVDSGGQVSGGIIIDIDQGHLQSLLQFTDLIPGATTVIVDSSGNLASASTEEAFLQPYADDETFSQILASTGNSGSFVLQENRQKKLVTWQRLSEADWTVISLLPSSHLEQRFTGIIRIVFLILVGVLVSALVIVFLSTRRIYRPIRMLVDHVAPENEPDSGNEIERITRKINAIQQDSAYMKKSMHLTMVQNLLFGIPVDTSGKNTPINGSSSYCVVTIRLLDLSDGSVENDQVIVALGNVAAGMLQDICPCETAAWANQAVMILCLDTDKLPDVIPLTLEQVCTWSLENLHMHAIIAVSPLVHTADRIHQAYAEAQLISQISFYGDHYTVVMSKDIQGWKSAPEIRVDDLAARLVACILDNREEELSRNIREFMALLRSCAPREARSIVFTLEGRILESLRQSLSSAAIAESELLRDSVLNASSSRELQQLLQALIRLCQDATGEYGINLRNLSVIRSVKTYVNENYQNPDLSLQSAAEQVGLSTGYLGRIFKSLEQKTFSEYLTSIRLEAARKKLLEKNKSVAEIAHEVGLDNQSYFSSLFRKNYGISPSAYRQASVKETNG